MFNVFMDDSGTDPHQRVVICTALIIPARRVVALENEWATFKGKEEFEEFHSAEACTKYKGEDSAFIGWDDDKVMRVMMHVAEIAMKYGVLARSWAVNKADYDAEIPDEWRMIAGQYHYTWAFRRTLYQLREWYEETGLSVPPEYILDRVEDKSAKEEIERVFEQEETSHPGEYENRYTFKKRQEIPGLQLVDLIAWSCFQLSRWIFEKTPMPPESTACMDKFSHHRRKDWLILQTNTREQLRAIVQKNLTDSSAENRRREWFRNYEDMIRGTPGRVRPSKRKVRLLTE